MNASVSAAWPQADDPERALARVQRQLAQTTAGHSIHGLERDAERPRAQAAARALAPGYQLLDAAAGGAPGDGEGANAVVLLGGAEGATGAARDRARALARRRIAKAVRLAAALPADLGAPLRRCAEGLSGQLTVPGRAS